MATEQRSLERPVDKRGQVSAPRGLLFSRLSKPPPVR